MADFILIHGGWAGAWQWENVAPRLKALGHRVFTPSLSGLGEKVRDAGPNTGLSTHIEDLLELISREDISDMALLGFSYGGMVATGVADRVPERIGKLIYLDAFVPRDGQSLFDIFGPDIRRSLLKITEAFGEGWRVPYFDTYDSRLTDQPIETAREPLRFSEKRLESFPRCYIECTHKDPQWSFTPILKALAAEWRNRDLPCYFLETGHFPMDSSPEELTELLNTLIE